MNHPRPSHCPRRRQLLAGLGALGLGLALAGHTPSRAQGVDLASVELSRQGGALNLSFDARMTLPKAVEYALEHGVPVYFQAQATLLRNRWYWRDERVARVSRSWRLAYQPLTATWRVSVGGFQQSFPNLTEALAVVTRATRWRLIDLSQLDNDGRYYVEFSFRLDTSQLPGPMQFGLGGQGDWQIGVERTLRLDNP